MLVIHIIIVALSLRISGAEKCLAGTFHKNVSSPGGSDFVECLKYKNNACCTGSLTKTIRDQPEMLYNFTWHHCKAISKPCLQYLKNEECFFQCEPTLIRYVRPSQSASVQNVPICSNYCDKWYEACKDDSTCVTNWESGFVIVGKHYACPNTSKCNTFKEVYKNGAGICNKMWGPSFSYHNASASCYTMGPAHTKSAANAMQPMTFLSGIAMIAVVVSASELLQLFSPN